MQGLLEFRYYVLNSLPGIELELLLFLNSSQKRSIKQYSEFSLFRSPMGLPKVAGISRWPHFRVPQDTRDYIRDNVTCIFSCMQGHCDWLVAS